MELVTKVKVSSVNNLTDARFFSGAGVEWIGFCFDESSEKYIPSEKVFQIKEWLAGPKIVAEFGNTVDREAILFATEQLKADIIELAGKVELSTLQEINSKVAIKVAIHQPEDIVNLKPYLQSISEHVSYFLFNFKERTIEWNSIKEDETALSTLKNLCNNFPIILEFDFSTGNINEVVETLSPFGIGLTGGDELQTGVKSFEKTVELLEALEAEI